VLPGLSCKQPENAVQGDINVKNLIARLFRRAIPQGNERGKRLADLRENPPEDPDVDPFDPFPSPVRLELTDVFDLHSIPPRDIKRAVVEYLCEARRLGFNSVRIIHGKGIGVQREAVRKILSETPFVTSFGDAPPDAGGWGATIARLSLR
jgi:dsDNA-specific endonuclease/ATPase MutS2